MSIESKIPFLVLCFSLPVWESGSYIEFGFPISLVPLGWSHSLALFLLLWLLTVLKHSAFHLLSPVLLLTLLFNGLIPFWVRLMFPNVRLMIRSRLFVLGKNNILIELMFVLLRISHLETHSVPLSLIFINFNHKVKVLFSLSTV